jgi:hypothetical protein
VQHSPKGNVRESLVSHHSRFFSPSHPFIERAFPRKRHRSHARVQTARPRRVQIALASRLDPPRVSLSRARPSPADDTSDARSLARVHRLHPASSTPPRALARVASSPSPSDRPLVPTARSSLVAPLVHRARSRGSIDARRDAVRSPPSSHAPSSSPSPPSSSSSSSTCARRLASDPRAPLRRRPLVR